MKNKLFLRDAGILNLNHKEKYFTKNEFFSRLDNAIELCSKYDLNLQLSISMKFFLDYKKNFYQRKRYLKKFDKITIHLHTYLDDPFGKDKITKKFISEVKKFFKVLNNVVGVCVHSDEVADFNTLKKFKTKNCYMAIENTDQKSKYGNKVEEVSKILNANKFLSLVVDTSHVAQIKKKFKSQPNFHQYISKFNKRCVEIQVSSNKNLYGNFFKNKFKTDHTLLSAGKTKIIDEMKKEDLSNKNIVIEGVVPYNKIGIKLLEKEIKLLTKITKL